MHCFSYANGYASTLRGGGLSGVGESVLGHSIDDGYDYSIQYMTLRKVRALTLLKCDSCGASGLEVDQVNQTAICKFCGSTYSEERIKELKIQIEGLTFEDLHNRANTFLRLRQWEQAEKVFAQIADLYPGKDEGWWGQVLAAAQGPVSNLAKQVPYEGEYTRLYEIALKCASPEQQQDIQAAFRPVLEARYRYENRLAKQAVRRRVATVASIVVVAVYVVLLTTLIGQTYLRTVEGFNGETTIVESLKGIFLTGHLPAGICAVIMAVLLSMRSKGGNGSRHGFRTVAVLIIAVTAVWLTYIEGAAAGYQAWNVVLAIIVHAVGCGVALVPGGILSGILSRLG